MKEEESVAVAAEARAAKEKVAAMEGDLREVWAEAEKVLELLLGMLQLLVRLCASLSKWK